MNKGRVLLFIAISMMACSAMDAQQSSSPKAKAKQESLIDLFHKHTYTGQYPLPQLPKASASLRSRAYDASGEPFVFPDKVWFPGEWEEVKAIVVSPDGYFQGYTERCGLKQTPQKSCVFRLIRSYIECGR